MNDANAIISEIQKKIFQPVYLLHGEEPYYIDLIEKAILENAVDESARDFDQVVAYGKDIDVTRIVGEARGFPLMGQRRLVIIREAQDVLKENTGNLTLLENYCEKPSASTVLVFCYKYKKFDSRKKLFKTIGKNGVTFYSEKVKDYNLVSWISNYLRGRNFSITPKANQLLADSLGNDLSKITNELNKLELLLPKGTTINEIHVEENIGISKDFNVFELVNALQVRDIPKAFQIVDYFDHNPKAAPLVVVIANLFNFFERLMRIHFSGTQVPDELARKLGIHPFAVKGLIQACRLYTRKKCAANIAVLHEFDLKSKGVGNSSATEGELMKEMIFKLMN